MIGEEMSKRSECWGEKPNEVEITPTCVFLRKDFQQIEQDNEGGAKVSGWSYLEDKVSYSQYLTLLNEEMKTNFLDIQEAITEVYEQLVGE